MTLDDAYVSCIRLAREHYENFPVASRLMPARLRPHIAAVYAFARHADDMADEGEISIEERRRQLETWRRKLVSCVTEASDHPVFLALGDTIRQFSIPERLFHDLLDAFVQDTHVREYPTFDALLEYCQRSANPVGRIVLALHGLPDDHTAPPSDALCTGLQLVNFWQDISVDRRKSRVYIPVEDLQRHGISVQTVLEGEDNHRLRTVIAAQVERTHRYFDDAIPLFAMVPLRLRLELSAIWRGGVRILEKIENQGYTTVRVRPSLSLTDKIAVFSGALLKGSPHARPGYRH
ncbi:MAG: squalene synthase HpnC [Bacteroidetes bacterium]|nr:squalene synthase HpnC [Bacteroidota bacterium]